VSFDDTQEASLHGIFDQMLLPAHGYPATLRGAFYAKYTMPEGPHTRGFALIAPDGQEVGRQENPAERGQSGVYGNWYAPQVKIPIESPGLWEFRFLVNGAAAGSYYFDARVMPPS
jgi:hypothetical protein